MEWNKELFNPVLTVVIHRYLGTGFNPSVEWTLNQTNMDITLVPGVERQNCRMPHLHVPGDPGGLTLWVSKARPPRATHFHNFSREPTLRPILLEIFCF